MAYSVLRPLLFQFDAERAHHLTLSMLKMSDFLGLTESIYSHEYKPVKCMGIDFPNAVGLAAGLDKNGDYIDALAALGFGFIEIGTVTPRPQAGNEKPRLFRLPEVNGIINRMGFNNDGVDKLVENVKKAKYKGVLGINIGKNADTPVEKATDDYLICLEKVYAYASYVVVNISSPNTQGLRRLQSGGALKDLLSTLKEKQQKLAAQYGFYVPLVLKVAPDLEQMDIEYIAEQLLHHQIDGLIVTNTTVSREGVEGLKHAEEKGGLSGGPVFNKSAFCLAEFHKQLQGKIPLIGVGGILNGEQARLKQASGATLVQLYSGLVYQGPQLIAECVKALDPV
ncbi:MULTISPECIES: quinone-dependent dihydroorotate dehydrogenase [unclassified Acinetobacter]|uniref:quinone-dependent dihydroorotate dehydrogenase n=1 Tax=unclassified Acinetobacter TaxID=196816 RepID=UPI0035BB0C6B